MAGGYRLSEQLSMEQLGGMMNCHPDTARRRLRTLERTSGKRVILEIATNKFASTLRLIQRADPDWIESEKVRTDEVVQFREVVREVKAGQRLLAGKIRELRQDVDDAASRGGRQHG